MVIPIAGLLGKRFSFLNLRVSRNSSSDYYSWFRLERIPAKLFIEVPMSGWFGKRLALLKFSASL
jgi:hypothetical protein